LADFVDDADGMVNRRGSPCFLDELLQRVGGLRKVIVRQGAEGRHIQPAPMSPAGSHYLQIFLGTNQ